jgi:outer membrane protein assembly factor BamB
MTGRVVGGATMSPRETGVHATRTIVALVLGALVASSCAWPMFRSGAARTGENRLERTISADNVAGLRKAWTDTTNAPVTSPVVSGSGVSYVAASGTLFAFDAAGKTGCSGTPKTCVPLWTGATGGSFESYVAVANGVVLVATGNTVVGTSTRVVAFDAKGQAGCTGTPKTCVPLWTGTASCEAGASACLLLSAPVVAGGAVYVGVTSAGTCCLASVQAFDAVGSVGCSGNPKTCTPLRKYVVDCQAAFTCQVSPAAVARGVVYVGSESDQQDFGNRGDLFAFDATGSVGCSGSPVTCTPLWTAPTEGVRGSPAVANGKVYVTDSSFPIPDNGSPTGSVRAFDAAGVTGCSGTPKTCAALWSVTLGPIFGSPAVARGSVYVGALNGNLHVLNAATGAKRWTGITGHGVDWSPTIANDVVYVASNGSMFAFHADGTKSCSGSPKSCTPLRTVASGPESSIGHEIAVVNGTVYVGGSDALRVFRLP